ARITARQARLTRQLAESTETAANAAEDSAKALPALERAYLFVEVRQGDPFPDLTARLRDAHLSGHEPAATAAPSTIYFWIKNHGKTPAVVKGKTFTLQYRADVDDPALLAPEPFQTGPIVIAGGTAEPKGSSEFLIVSLNQPLRSEEIKR